MIFSKRRGGSEEVMVKPKSPQKVLDNLKRQCSKREYCVADVKKKAIQALCGNTVEAEKIVHTLLQEKYVDDSRYAEAYVRDKSSIAGWGVSKIRYMLSMKGIAKDVIEDALEEVDSEKASSRLNRLLEYKYKSLSDDPQWKMKLLRYALGRGYGYDQVNIAIRKLQTEQFEG